VELGPFGGAESGGATLVGWAVAFLVLVGFSAVMLFRRRDL
jgi:hypothetical protein